VKYFLRLALTACLLSVAAAAQDTPLQQIPASPALNVSDMDRTANPCQDFYQYACGGWIKNNPIPADRPRWDVYAKLAQDNERVLWGVALADSKMTDRTPVQQKVGDYFAACMDTAAVDALGMKPLEMPLQAIDRLQEKSGLTTLLAHAHSHGAPLLFEANSMQDYGDAEKVIVGFGAGGLSGGGANGGGPSVSRLVGAGGAGEVGLDHDLKERERELIFATLRITGGSRKLAAERLGISPRTLRHKLQQFKAAGVAVPQLHETLPQYVTA